MIAIYDTVPLMAEARPQSFWSDIFFPSNFRLCYRSSNAALFSSLFRYARFLKIPPHLCFELFREAY
jgi:hypothetical protein